MHLSARSDYALRALVELAAAGVRPTTREQLANTQHIPVKFLAIILQQLKTAGLVRTIRGPEGGYQLARRADQISLADAIRAVDGPLANVRGERPEDVEYEGAAEPLQRVWIALRANMRNVLEHVTLEDVACNHLPGLVEQLARAPEAWLAADAAGRSPAVRDQGRVETR